jgi:CheY-like chemotaxis protein
MGWQDVSCLHSVYIHADGVEALARLASIKADLLIVDVMMP